MTTSVRMVLEPPYTRGAGSSERSVSRPVMLGPPLIRTTDTGRWHRPRAGVLMTTSWGSHTSWHLWCGQHVPAARCTEAASVPDGDELCGTCEGRAVGAGHPALGVEPTEALVFAPASRYRTPRVCPGSRRGMVPDGRARYGACVACGEVVPWRACGGPYNPDVKAAAHEPGPGLLDPCPFHGWACLSLVEGSTRATTCSSGAA